MRIGRRSALAIRLAIPILGLFGIGISGYLTYVHYQWVEPICLAGLDCNNVLFTPYAQIGGIPIALLGLIMYFAVTVCGLLLLRKRQKGASSIALGIYVMALSGTLYSVYLIYLELFKIRAFCSWCLGSALVITSILALSLVDLSARRVRLTVMPSLTRTNPSMHKESVTP